MTYRIGLGYDVHRLVADRPLVLGGIVIPFELGLLGYSDADVLTHAVIDSLLGALALGDIGNHFPDTDSRYSGANSLLLLKQVWALIQDHGYQLANLDSVLIAERPKLKPYLDDMRVKMAECLKSERKFISIKATTTEKLGFTGREEGIAAKSMVLLQKMQ